MPKIDGKQVKNGTIDTAQLAANAVETAKILDSNVTEAKLAASAVTTGKINDDAVDKTKINADIAGAGLAQAAGGELDVGAAAASAITVNANDIAVATDDATIEDDGGTPGALRVKDLGISTAKLALLAVDTGQLAASAVTAAKADLTSPWSFTADNLQVTSAPDSDNDVANKAYVDAVAQGLTIKEPVRLATIAALPAYTTAGSGVGKTITISSVGILTIDGVDSVLGDRILVKNEGASDLDHGIYEVTTEGTGGIAAILTRTTDYDTTAEVVDGSFSFVEQGTTLASSSWVLTTNNPITVDTTALTFAQFSGAGTYTGGDGVDVSGTVISVDLKASGGLKFDTGELAVEPSDLDGVGLEVIANQLAVDLLASGGLKFTGNEIGVEPNDFAGAGLEDDGSDNLRLTTQGNGITGGAGSSLSVLADPTTGPSIAVDAGGVRAAVPYIGNKNHTPAVTSGDDFNTTVAVAVTPAHPSSIRVTVNGLEVSVGDGVDTEDCYFATTGAPTVPLSIDAVAATDILVWNGATNAGYQLAATDEVSLDYSYVV